MSNRQASHANRGTYLEHMIDHTWAAYIRQGVGCGQKVATPAGQTRRGRFYRERSTVDYLGHVRGIPVAFDAKACTKAQRLPLARLKRHQRLFLDDWSRAGGVAFLLVDFPSHPTFYALTLEALDNLAKGRASAAGEAIMAAAGSPARTGVVQVPRGKGVPVPFADAVRTLWERQLRGGALPMADLVADLAADHSTDGGQYD